MLPLLAFPPVWINATHGQNAYVTAALFVAAALALDRRAALAGLCVAGLAIKPHLAILVPLAWLASGRWRAIAAAAAGSLGFVALAAAVFGTESIAAFLALSPLARATLEDGLVGHEKMVSVFAGVRLLGGGIGLAWAVQGLVAAAVVAVLLPRLRRRPGGVAEMAAVAAATPLVSPFLLDYDLLLLALPLASCCARRCARASCHGSGSCCWPASCCPSSRGRSAPRRACRSRRRSRPCCSGSCCGGLHGR